MSKFYLHWKWSHGDRSISLLSVYGNLWLILGGKGQNRGHINSVLMSSVGHYANKLANLHDIVYFMYNIGRYTYRIVSVSIIYNWQISKRNLSIDKVTYYRLTMLNCSRQNCSLQYPHYWSPRFSGMISIPLVTVSYGTYYQGDQYTS